MSRLWFVAGLVLVPMLAQADSLHADEKGGQLKVEFSCARQVKVQAEPGLSGEVVMDAAADHPEEIAQLVFTGGDKVELKPKGECWQGPDKNDFQPTLDIVFKVPAAFPLGISAAGSTTFHVAVGGELSVDLSGSGALDATRVTKLHLDLSGSGGVRVDEVAGPIALDVSGSARILIKQAESDTMAASISGSGTVRIAAGRLGQVVMEDSGSGNLVLGGTVGSATAALSGSGNVSIAKLTGRLTQDVSGSGTIEVVSH